MRQIPQGLLATNNLGFVMHGAMWKDPVSNEGFVFTGNSGVGKSTISKIMSRSTDYYNQLSDDRLVVRKKGNIFWGFGNPFDFKIQKVSNDSAAIKYIFFLNHSDSNKIIELPEKEKLKRLLTVAMLPYWDKRLLSFSALLLFDFAKQIRVYDLFFKPDQDIIPYILNEIK